MKIKRKYIAYIVIIVSMLVLMTLFSFANNDILDLLGSNLLFLTIVAILFRESRNVKSQETSKAGARLRWIFPSEISNSPILCMYFVIFIILVCLLVINIYFFAGRI